MLCQCCQEAFLERALAADLFWCPYCGFVMTGRERARKRRGCKTTYSDADLRAALSGGKLVFSSSVQEFINKIK